MIHKTPKKYVLVFLILASVAALSGAYIAQYYFGMEPCQLCYWQRKPFFVIIVLAILFLTIPYLKKHQRLGINLLIILLLINAGIAFYHSGVERKYFEGLTSCSSVSMAPTNIVDLEKMLMATKAIPCDQPQFIFLDLSMAEWNLVYCLVIVFLTCIILRPSRFIRFKKNQ